MSLERKAIRRWAANLLKGETYAGDNVTASRSVPHQSRSGPAITVYTLNEDVTIHTDTPRVYLHTLELAVEVWAEEDPERNDVASVDDVLDDLMDQVRCCLEPLMVEGSPDEPDALGQQSTARGKIDFNPSLIQLQRVEIEFEGEGRQVIGASRMVWLIPYGTCPDERGTADATDLVSVGVTYDFPPPDGTLEGGDDIALPQA